MASVRAGKAWRRAIVAVALVGCGSSESASGIDPYDAGQDGWFDAGSDQGVDLGTIVHVDGGGFDGASDGDDAGWFNPLCGARHCDPDDPVICTSLPHDGGVDGDAADGDSGVVVVEGGTDAFVDEVAGSGTTSACRVVDDGTAIASVCAPAGTADEKAFCSTDADCKPGFACAGHGAQGQCFAYCCDAISASDGCPSGRYCTSLASFANPAQQVPICALLDECTLLASPDGCVTGSTCTVVTNAGDTACVPVGTGTEGGACPCAAGYVCTGASTARACRKLCRVDGDCAPEVCQPLPSIPVGFGLCAPAG